MSHVTRNLKQTVTWWRVTGNNGFGGYTFAAPISIPARWQDTAVMFRDQKGDEVVSRSVVFLDRDVAINDYLSLGDIDTADPTTLETAWQVKQFQKDPDLRNSNFLRKAFL